MLKTDGNILTLTGSAKRADLISAIVEMYRVAVTHMPQDVVTALRKGLKTETNPRAKHVLKTMLKNIDMADCETRPLCQDTGIPLVYVKYQSNTYKQLELKKIITELTQQIHNIWTCYQQVVVPVTIW